MRDLERRITFGVLWFGIFWLAIMFVGGSVAAMKAGGPAQPIAASEAPNYQQMRDTSMRAGIEFREQYGRWVLVSSAVLAATGAVLGLLPGTRQR